MRTCLLFLTALSLLLTHCVRPTPVAGGGTTTTDNAKVTGSVCYAGGLPAAGAAVHMRLSTYLQPLPSTRDSAPRYDTITDAFGGFSFDSVSIGDYRIEFNDLKTSAALSACKVSTNHDSIILAADTLLRYATIQGKVDSAEMTKGKIFVRVYGLDRLAAVDSMGIFSLPDLPASTFRLLVSALDTAVKPVVIDSVRTAPDSVTKVLDTGKTIPADTTSPVAGQWTHANGPYVGTVKCIAVSALGDIFAGTNGGGVFRSTDNAATWTAANNGLSNAVVQCLAISASGGYLFAGTQGGVFRSADKGVTWTTVSTGLSASAKLDVRGIVESPDGLGGSALFIGTQYNGVYKSSNNGASWTVINTSDSLTDQTFVQCLAVFSKGTSGGTVFVGTDRDGVFRSNDNGLTWTQVNNGLTDVTIFCLATSPDMTRLYAGTMSGVFVSNDSGATWVLHSIPNNFSYVTSLAVRDSSNILAASYGYGVFITSDGGTKWSAANSGLSSLYVNALAISGSSVFAGVDYDGMFISRNSGATWTIANNGLTNVDITSFTSSGNYLFAGGTRGVFLSQDNALSWKEVDSGLTNWRMEALAVTHGSAGPDNLFAASGSGVSLSTDYGSHWTAINGTWKNVTIDALAVIGTTVFAGADNGGSTTDHGIFTTQDNGASWTAASTGIPNIDSLGITTFAVDSNGPGPLTIFAGTTSGGIFRSTDKGASWTAVNNGLTTATSLTIHSLAVGLNGTNGTIVMAGTENGLFVSNNNGDSWAAANSGLPTYPLVLSFAVVAKSKGGSNFFAAMGGGPAFNGVYYSTNYGATWKAIQSGLPNSWIYAFYVYNNFLFAGTTGYGVWKIPLR